MAFRTSHSLAPASNVQNAPENGCHVYTYLYVCTYDEAALKRAQTKNSRMANPLGKNPCDYEARVSRCEDFPPSAEYLPLRN